MLYYNPTLHKNNMQEIFNDEQYKWFIVRYNDFVETNNREDFMIRYK